MRTLPLILVSVKFQLLSPGLLGLIQIESVCVRYAGTKSLAVLQSPDHRVIAFVNLHPVMQFAPIDLKFLECLGVEDFLWVLAF